MVGRCQARVAVVLLAVVVLALVTPSTSSSSGSVPYPPTLAVAGPCSSADAPAAPQGTAEVDGGTLGPDAMVGAIVAYSFHIEERIVEGGTGTLHGESCLQATDHVTVRSNGTFAFPSVVPATECNNVTALCVLYSGPFGPYTLGPSAAPPPGYSTSVRDGPDGFQIAFVYDLESVLLVPEGPSLTVAPGAPTVVTAEGLMANGSATPLAPEFGWSLNGTGWSFSGAPLGATATVVAASGAGIGRLAVSASATVAGLVLTPPTTTLALVEVPTTIEEAALGRTTVDVGSTIAARLTGVGAAGYPYSATVSPGLGLGDVPAQCGETPAEGGMANLSCSANLTYPLPGIAQPTVRLTNGFSSSDWRFPDVTVDRAPELSVASGPPVGYAGTPLAITIVAANGSGASPFSDACLSLLPGNVTCLATPGPTWRFLPTFPTSGAYSALAWAIDGQGVNGSIAFPVEIVPPLTVGPITVVGANFSAGISIALSASLSGGDLPLRYWWNASDVDGSILVGTEGSDGPLSVSLVPPSAGEVTVSLTAVDALGTFAGSERLLVVGPENALTITAIDLPPATSVVAGSSFDLAWAAIDRSGDIVRDFGATAEIVLDGATGPLPAEVNASGLGPLSPLGNGTFAVPASGWVGGILNLSVSVRTAGPLWIGLRGAALPSPGVPLEVVVAPDRAYLRLFDPVVAHAGSRTNATFWQVTDRYANPALGAPVTLHLRWGSESVTTVIDAISAAGGTGVWLNYSAPGGSSGNLTVLDAAGQTLLGPIAIPAAPLPTGVSPATVTLVAAVPIGVIGAAWLGIGRRRAHRSAASRIDEEELRRLAEGRGQAVEIVRRAGTIGLEEIEAAWDPRPAPAELSDWLASLVTDGTLGAAVGEDGRARFRLADGRPASPRVTVDTPEFDRGQVRRDELFDDRGAP